MFQKINISLADKIEASKNTVSNPDISTNSIPNTVNGSPGDSAISQPNLSGINSAGNDVSQKQSEAQTGTDPQARAAAIPGDIKYQNPQDTEYPTEQDPSKVTPTPKSKGFMESLIEARATDYMQQKSQTPEAQNNTNTQTIEDPNIAKAPDNKRVDKPQTTTWSPKSIGDRDNGLPNQDLMNGIIDRRSTPAFNNKTYNPINYNAPKIATPRMPRLK